MLSRQSPDKPWVVGLAFLSLTLGNNWEPRLGAEPPNAHQAIAAMDSACQTSQWLGLDDEKSFVVDCSTEKRALLYYARIESGDVVFSKLEDAPKPGSYTLRHQRLTFSTATPKKIERSWALDLHAELQTETEERAGICTPERYRDHFSYIAANLRRPGRIKNVPIGRVAFLHDSIECQDGTPQLVRHKGIVIPIDGKQQAIRAYGETLFTSSGKKLDDPLPGFGVRVQIDHQAKVARIILEDFASLRPYEGTDARTSRHFEIWLPPRREEPTCEEALSPERACQAKVQSGTRILLGLAKTADVYKPILMDEQGKPVQEVRAAANSRSVTLSLSGRLYEDLKNGVSITYHDPSLGLVFGTADSSKGDYGVVESVGDLDPRPYKERRVSLTPAR